MGPTCDSSQTNRLLRHAGMRDPQALAELFARHRERLRKMVRLRLDGRLRGRISSSTILEEVFRDVEWRFEEYLGNRSQSFFLWLREATGERLQQLHRQHFGKAAEAEQEIHLHSGAMPEVNAASMAAQLMGDRAANQAALRADLLLQLQTALNGLDPLARELLALRHFEELSNEAAAAVLGIEPAAANIRYLQALKRLNEILRSIPGFFASQRGPSRA
jgi:RNA polymerase sigma-70 factor (ECF subfamily)